MNTTVEQYTTEKCGAPNVAPWIVNVHTAHSNPSHNNGQLEDAWNRKSRSVLDYEKNANGDNPVHLVDPFDNDEQTVLEALDDCLRVYHQSKLDWRTLDIVGLYNIGCGLWSNWTMIRQDDRFYKEWLPGMEIYSAGQMSYVSQVPAICPAFYVPNDWLKDWTKWKPEAMKVVRRVVGLIRTWRKPCVAYARPQGMKHRDWREWLWFLTDYCSVIVWEDVPQDERIWKGTAQVVEYMPKTAMPIQLGE